MTVAPERPSLVEETAVLETLPVLEIYTPPVVRREIDTVILLPHQIRDKKHTRADELGASIEKIGVDNPPNIAVANSTIFAEYLDFQNRLWGTKYTLEQFVDQRVGDDTYQWVFAGHNRTREIKKQAVRFREQVGGHAPVIAPFKEFKDPSIEQILYVQYAENLHQSVRTEREAQYILEYYTYGLEQGKWTNPKEFRKSQAGRVDKKMMEQVMAFNALSPKVQADVFAGTIPYRAGIILGQMVPIIEQHFRKESGIEFGPMEEDVQAVVQLGVETELSAQSTHIYNVPGMRNNAPAASKYLKSIRDQWVKEIDGPVALSEDIGFDALGDIYAFENIEMCGIKEQAERELRRRRSELAKNLKTLGEEPHLVAAEVLIRHQHLLPMMGEQICKDVVQANGILSDNIEQTLNREAENNEASLFDELEDEFAVA